MDKVICLISLYVAPVFLWVGVVQAQVVTNTQSDGPGSLHAAIDSANAYPGTTIRFEIDPLDPENDCPASFCRIRIEAPLPTITSSGTVLDGLSQRTDTTWIGPGEAVGFSQTSFPAMIQPAIEIVDGADLPTGLDIQAENVVVRGVSIYGFGNDPENSDHANVRIDIPLTTLINLTNYVLLEHNRLGMGIGRTGEPDDENGGANVVCMDGLVHLRHNWIGFAGGAGVLVPPGTASKGLFEFNQIQGNGMRSNQPGLYLASGFDNLSVNLSHSVQYNRIEANRGAGVEKIFLFPRMSIFENDIVGNGIGSTREGTVKTAGLHLNGQNFVFQNHIYENMGAGILIWTTGQSQLSKNLIHDNGSIQNLDGDGPTGQIGIDLLGPEDQPDRGTPPFVTPNDLDDLDIGGNGLFNAPVLTDAIFDGDSLSVTGYSRPFSLIEFYIAELDPSGFGEGGTYLFSGQEGTIDDMRPDTVMDRDTTVGEYEPGFPHDGIGTDRTNRFRFVVPFSDVLSPNLILTATATDRGEPSVFCIEGCTYPTSEFSSNQAVGSTTWAANLNPSKKIYRFEAVFPNPFSSRTTLQFSLEKSQQVSLVLYDVMGRKVDTLFDGTAGGVRIHTVDVDGSGLVSGIYFARLSGPGIDSVQPLIHK